MVLQHSAILFLFSNISLGVVNSDIFTCLVFFPFLFVSTCCSLGALSLLVFLINLFLKTLSQLFWGGYVLL